MNCWTGTRKHCARDLDAALGCYTADAVVQAPDVPTVEGPDVRGLYQQIFAAIVLDITFSVEATVRADDGTLAVFTHSNGTQTDTTSGVPAPEANREAFVLRPVDGQLKIARYLFNVAG